ncbi:transcriptional regulator [Nakamurella antarctica]|uniref:Transcriptional regulator n=2 Tax=Nakamurella antarctica TaxID=1902245 RepID=A0A3G8ZPU8_9ACTN|nr:transcriptional regulator [Nakamurella antarctica]
MHGRAVGVNDPYVDLAAEVFGVLADATRIRIILALHAGEMAVNELAGKVGKTPAGVSQHLAKLRWARMVATRQDGTRVFYRLTDEHARKLVADAVFQAEHAVDEGPAHHRAIQFPTPTSSSDHPDGAV